MNQERRFGSRSVNLVFLSWADAGIESRTVRGAFASAVMKRRPDEHEEDDYDEMDDSEEDESKSDVLICEDTVTDTGAYSFKILPCLFLFLTFL